MDTYNKYYGKKKLKLKKCIVNYISKILISIIFFLISIIFISQSDNKILYNKLIFDNSLSFAKINDWYNKKFGSIIPLDNISNSQEVFNETLSYSSMERYLDGYILSVNNNYTIPSLNSGVVVFIGEKDNYGNTVIVQGVDGVDIWYTNISNSNYSLYDYVTKGSPIGNTIDNKLYLVFMKDNNYISYEEFNNI